MQGQPLVSVALSPKCRFHWPRNPHFPLTPDNAVQRVSCIVAADSFNYLYTHTHTHIIVVQLQLSQFSHHCSPLPCPPSLSQCPPCRPLPCILYTCFPSFPSSSLSSFLSDHCQFVPYFLISPVLFCFFVLFIRFLLQVRSYGICLSPPGLFYLA